MRPAYVTFFKNWSMKLKCPNLRNAQIPSFWPKSCFLLASEVFKVYQIRSKDPVVYTMGLKHFRRFFCLQKCNSTHFICHPCAQKLENYYVCQILSAFKFLPKNSSLPEFASEILLRLYLFFNCYSAITISASILM